MDIITISPPTQAAAPAVLDLSAAAPDAPDTIVLPGTSGGGGGSVSVPAVLPIDTPEQAASPGVVPLETPDAADAPEVLPVEVGGASSSPIINQAQLDAAVAALQEQIAAGTRPVITKADGSKVELTFDETDTLEQQPIPRE